MTNNLDGYTVVLREEDGDIVARIPELPGCIAHGDTDAEALTMLIEVKALWIEDCVASGHAVPEPCREAD